MLGMTKSKILISHTTCISLQIQKVVARMLKSSLKNLERILKSITFKWKMIKTV